MRPNRKSRIPLRPARNASSVSASSSSSSWWAWVCERIATTARATPTHTTHSGQRRLVGTKVREGLWWWNVTHTGTHTDTQAHRTCENPLAPPQQPPTPRLHHSPSDSNDHARARRGCRMGPNDDDGAGVMVVDAATLPWATPPTLTPFTALLAAAAAGGTGGGAGAPWAAVGGATLSKILAASLSSNTALPGAAAAGGAKAVAMTDSQSPRCDLWRRSGVGTPSASSTRRVQSTRTTCGDAGVACWGGKPGEDACGGAGGLRDR